MTTFGVLWVNSALMNDTNAKKLIAYMREENECERKHGRKMLRMKMQMNLQMYQVLSQNMVVHPQQFQFWLVEVTSSSIMCPRIINTSNYIIQSKSFVKKSVCQLFFPKYGIWFFLITLFFYRSRCYWKWLQNNQATVGKLTL